VCISVALPPSLLLRCIGELTGGGREGGAPTLCTCMAVCRDWLRWVCPHKYMEHEQRRNRRGERGERGDKHEYGHGHGHEQGQGQGHLRPSATSISTPAEAPPPPAAAASATASATATATATATARATACVSGAAAERLWKQVLLSECSRGVFRLTPGTATAAHSASTAVAVVEVLWKLPPRRCRDMILDLLAPGTSTGAAAALCVSAKAMETATDCTAAAAAASAAANMTKCVSSAAAPAGFRERVVEGLGAGSFCVWYLSVKRVGWAIRLAQWRLDKKNEAKARKKAGNRGVTLRPQ
jgi:hypothetical protein